jgi:hypothetical protein
MCYEIRRAEACVDYVGLAGMPKRGRGVSDGQHEQRSDCVCLLLQDLVQSCLHWGGYGRTCPTNMSYHRRQGQPESALTLVRLE